jgi:hypothetical protein
MPETLTAVLDSTVLVSAFLTEGGVSVEIAFSMIKAKFGDAVRSKSHVGQ